MVPLSYYLAAAACLFSVGIIGLFLNRKNRIKLTQDTGFFLPIDIQPMGKPVGLELFRPLIQHVVRIHQALDILPLYGW